MNGNPVPGVKIIFVDLKLARKTEKQSDFRRQDSNFFEGL